MNRIKMYLSSLGRGTRVLVLSLAVVFGSAAVVQAATTIGTNVTTAGSISTTGSGTMSIAGLATLLGGATTTQITLLSGDTIKNATASTTVISGNLTTSTTTITGLVATGNATLASTTIALSKTGQLGTQMTQATFGYCSFTDVTLAASSTAGFTECTTVPAGVLVAGDRVFVQATSSFESQYVITAASTTGVSTIQLRILNTGLGTADGTLSGTSVNFWAVR